MASKTANMDAAHRLDRGLTLRQRMLHSAPVNIIYVAGSDNNLADIASRAITQLDDDHAFLPHFDTLFHLQEQSWQRASPPPAQLCNVISMLRGQRLTMQRWTLQLGPPAGLVAAILHRLWNRSVAAGHNTRNPPPATLGICRPDSYWILWERLAGWSPDCQKGPASRGTSLRVGRIPRPPTRRSQL
jgi:hypothetical protein